MRFMETEIKDLYIIEAEPYEDARGGFSRTYCEDEFKAVGIECNFVQDSISQNHKKNTLRGMHWQEEPYTEDKLVRCIKGKVFDVAVDMRKDSPTYLKWVGIELSEENQRAFFIPKGFAHGFQTLEDNSTLYYKMSHAYVSGSGRGIKYDDPKVAIKWKKLKEDITISEQDRNWEKL